MEITKPPQFNGIAVDFFASVLNPQVTHNTSELLQESSTHCHESSHSIFNSISELPARFASRLVQEPLLPYLNNSLLPEQTSKPYLKNIQVISHPIHCRYGQSNTNRQTRVNLTELPNNPQAITDKFMFHSRNLTDTQLEMLFESNRHKQENQAVFTKGIIFLAEID